MSQYIAAGVSHIGVVMQSVGPSGMDTYKTRPIRYCLTRLRLYNYNHSLVGSSNLGGTVLTLSQAHKTLFAYLGS